MVLNVNVLVIVNLLEVLLAKVLDRYRVDARTEFRFEKLFRGQLLLKIQYRSTGMDLPALFVTDLAGLQFIDAGSDVKPLQLRFKVLLHRRLPFRRLLFHLDRL